MFVRHVWWLCSWGILHGDAMCCGGSRYISAYNTFLIRRTQYSSPHSWSAITSQHSDLSMPSNCIAGFFNPFWSHGSYYPCPAGTYANALGSTACSLCPAGKFSGMQAGSTSCSDCPRATQAGAASCAISTLQLPRLEISIIRLFSKNDLFMSLCVVISGWKLCGGPAPYGFGLCRSPSRCVRHHNSC